MLAACCCWGLENNCTRRLSEKSAAQIVILKGIFSGLGSMIVAWIGGEQFPQAKYAALVMLLGFVAYGLSIYFYVRAQKDLGAARTSACYAVNPFVGSLLSLAFLQEPLSRTYPAALGVMLVGTALTVWDTFWEERRRK